MSNITHLKESFSRIDSAVKKIIHGGGNKRKVANEISEKWVGEFERPLSAEAIDDLATYYMSLFGGGEKKQSGGAYYDLTGATLNYSVGPGTYTIPEVYGKFPSEIGADPATLKGLDIYYNSGLSHSCGHEDITAKIPADMGQNTFLRPDQIGGSMPSKYARKTRKSRVMKKKSRKNVKKGMKGGNLMNSLTRPYISSVPPNVIQTTVQDFNGAPVPQADGHAVSHNWSYVSGGIMNTINPNQITPIRSDITQLARPAPYQNTA